MSSSHHIHYVNTSTMYQSCLSSVGRARTHLPALLSWYRGCRPSMAAGRAASTTAAAAKTLMIVESPTKAEKIQKFLGSQYEVQASYGHLIDLAQRQGAVQPAADFALSWEVQPRGAQRLAALAAAAARAQEVVLATDPDREGEAISWHLLQELQRRGAMRPGQPATRITFTEVTKKALTDALKHKRSVDQDLVDAYLARRCLDWLVGFTISPVLWQKLTSARSAGRVQSVALRLVCEREEEVERFVPVPYWSLGAELAAAGGQPPGSFAARLVQVDGVKLQKVDISTQQQADQLAQRLQDASTFTVSSCTRKPFKRAPPAPFITSTLQREAASRLSWGTKKTMQVAQQLYEGAGAGEGLISYMRTDGVTLSSEAINDIRSAIQSCFGAEQLPAQPRAYKSKAKNAQEAHEAIRPTSMARAPEQLPASCTPDQRRLYELIWRRTMACQMPDAQLQQVTVEAQSPGQDLVLRASSSTISSPGFLAVYGTAAAPASSSTSLTDSGDDDDLAAAAAAPPALHVLLQQLQVGDQLALQQVLSTASTTRPPPRYTEASMVRSLEELGIGRPSTYASILSTLLARQYIVKEGSALVPQPLGRLLNGLLVAHLGQYVDVDFTSKMEADLDEVSGGQLDWKQLLRHFWGPFEASVKQLKGLSTQQVFEGLDQELEPWLLHVITQRQQQLSDAAADKAAQESADSSSSSQVADAAHGLQQQEGEQHAAAAGGVAASSDPRCCPLCGGRLVLKPARSSGGFIGCSNYASKGCKYGVNLKDDLGDLAALGSGSESDDPDDQASASVPVPEKLLGHDPDTGAPVVLKKGPYGLYVQKGGEGTGIPLRRTSVPPSAAASLDLQAALVALALPREVGTHPQDGALVLAGVGRFGPYVQHHNLYAALPKDGPGPLEVSLDQALQLIEAKVAKAAARGLDPYKKPARATKKKRTSGGPAGFHLFVREQRQTLQSQQPEATAAELRALATEAWRQLSLPERQRWAAAAAAAQDSAAAAANAGDETGEGASKGGRAVTGKGSGRRKAGTAGRSSSSSSTGSKSSGSSGRQKGTGNKAAKPAAAPAKTTAAANQGAAKSVSPYHLFMKQQGKQLLQLPEYQGKPLFWAASEAWKQLSEEEKHWWVQLTKAPVQQK